MSANNISPLLSFQNSWKSNQHYFKMLGIMASLSKLFSDNTTPYLDYRLAENLFCRYFRAQNDARSCTAYDARLSKLGLGIKTFILKEDDSSTEKIAEFNKLKSELDKLDGYDLAYKLGEFRNERMRFANDSYDVTQSVYHIVGRKDGLLRVFNTPYQEVDLSHITNVVSKKTGLSFSDGRNEYNFNRSKTVLMKKFIVSDDVINWPVQILDDPYQLIERLFSLNPASGEEDVIRQTATDSDLFLPRVKRKGRDYVVLPLYSTRDNKVPLKSGLNQWNADGRARDEDEVYIPVPSSIHKNYPNFFPPREENFNLRLPDGQLLSAKICQAGGKALMSNPNRALGNWILRKVLHKAPGTLVTMADLNKFGIDSVYIEKQPLVNASESVEYKISFSDNYDGYESFINN